MAFWIMFAVSLSGFVGRYLYSSDSAQSKRCGALT